MVNRKAPCEKTSAQPTVKHWISVVYKCVRVIRLWQGYLTVVAESSSLKNSHYHSLPVSKDRPDHLSHCALAAALSHLPAHEQMHTGQHGRQEIDDRSEALELQSSEENRETEAPPARRDG